MIACQGRVKVAGRNFSPFRTCKGTFRLSNSGGSDMLERGCEKRKDGKPRYIEVQSTREGELKIKWSLKRGSPRGNFHAGSAIADSAHRARLAINFLPTFYGHEVSSFSSGRERKKRHTLQKPVRLCFWSAIKEN